MKRNIYLSDNANSILTGYLESRGYSIKKITGTDLPGSGISTHPDIYMCKLGFRDEAPVFFGDPNVLTAEYPGDVPFNAACSGRFFIHNLSYTDPELLATAEELGCTMVNVKQGYAKCSTLIADEDSFITSDRGIAKELGKAGADVLLIEPGHIVLPGFGHGFIGGACGIAGREMIFNGDLSGHPDFLKIKDYLESRELEVRYFSEFPLEDIGSIITEVRKDGDRR